MLTTFDIDVSKSVNRFSDYTNEMESLIRSVRNLDQNKVNDLIGPRILNGEATMALQRLVPINIRKDAGLFFTSNKISEKVASRILPMLQRGSKILDPACGAGNLLIACARHLPIGLNLGETLTLWSDKIFGYDLYTEFISATRLRLALLALSIHPNDINLLPNLQLDQLFNGLKAGDGLSQSCIEQDICIAVNPPFGHISAPADCKWGTGKIQVAAWFLERLLLRTTEGQNVVAILPDVLRSGTRYLKWRNMISSLCTSIDIEEAGRFDNNTDVDVFILHIVRGDSSGTQLYWPTHNSLIRQSKHVVSDFFDVCVGPVVPHRDPLQGPSYPYIHARTAPAWQTIDFIPEDRQYTGKVFSPPFLVIHRTSSPSDRHRCVTTIINDKREVAVENHLLIIQPHDRSIYSCNQLLRLLKSPETDKWLNNRIRCRHLTVSAIRELPYSTIGQDKQQ